jgi:hypothetical protein
MKEALRNSVQPSHKTINAERRLFSERRSREGSEHPARALNVERPRLG